MMKRVLSIIGILLIAACGKKDQKPKVVVGKPVLIAPLNNQPCISGTVLSATQSSVIFSWAAATGADHYDLTIEDLLTKTSTTQSSSITSATITLLRNNPYAWYVTAKTGKSTSGTASDTWKFYNSGAGIVSYAPFPAEIISPAFGAVIDGSAGTVNLTWKGSSVNSNIVAYSVYFGPTSNPDLFKDQITDSFVNNVAIGSNTTYYWRVVTIDSNGNISDSGTYNFFVK